MTQLPVVRLQKLEGPQPKPILMGMPRRAPVPSGRGALAIDEFLQRYPLPPRTAALGYCDNGLPMLFDLADPRAGPIMVLGDSESGKSNLVRVLLSSAAHFSTPHDFQYLLFAAHPDEYAGLCETGKQSGHCLGCLGTYDQDACKGIIRMASMAEERYNSDRPAPAIVIVFDDLCFATGLDIDTRLNFEWLLKHGPPVQIWPVALLTTQAALDMGRWTSQFRTRLIGNMPQKAAHRLSMYEGLQSDQILAGKQFGIHIHNSWLRFWVPVIDYNEKAGGQNEDRNAVV
ncbi:MAG TPA: FtsK/SpoIIIE domain-containing protein [Levilinea sp.]|nr:FtsK/SpoIIIE domain-containing protein [Levilinea sp.]